MKTIFKISIVLSLLLSPLGAAQAWEPVVSSSPRALLKELFPRSERVGFRRFALDPETKGRLSRRLGYAPPRSEYVFYVASSGGRVDGYALIDEELGQHQPITFATQLDARGVVVRQEIMVYREPRGDEIRDVRFRRQFVGKSGRDPIRVDDDIVAVSGASISSRAMAIGVRRAVILCEELLLRGLPGPATASTAQRLPSYAR